MTSLTKELIRERFNYDPNTGELTYNISLKGTKAGSSVGSAGASGKSVCINYKRYQITHIIWMYVYGILPDKIIDHINGNPMDNRLCNLRQVTQSENLSNKHHPQNNNKLGILGVDKLKNNKYRARIKLNGKSVYLGVFETSEEAHQCYLLHRKTYHPVEGVTNHYNRSN